MSGRVVLHATIRRVVKGGSALAVVLGVFASPLALTAAPAGAISSATTSYTPGTPVVDTITNGTSAAPWNESQGDPGTAPYASQSPGTLLPTYTPGGTTTGSGPTAEPNLAVYPGASSGSAAGNSPYPSGVVGTPGPLDGYCGSGSQPVESAGTPVRQPPGTTLPFAPAYFPHVVRNTDGSLTGYFDYRPKDADEALVAANSTDGGKSWTYEGEALEQNSGYCPTADTNDDGQGHANVITVGGTSYLYTLPRPAGDNSGVGMLVHTLNPTSGNPLATLPASEPVGIDPDAFATASTPVPFTGGSGATIPVNQTGQANSPEQLVPGPFVDLTLTPTPTASSIISCAGVTSTTLTGCTTAAAGGVTIGSGNLIEQVVGTVTTASTIPTGPNNTLGTGGLANLPIAFSNNITATILNNNAPNRIYVDGVAVYCTQGNASPTTKAEDCTTGPGGPSVSAAVGDPVTTDPTVPATAQQSNGLVAPDGIVGVLPAYPGAPAGSTIVMYTEKILNYYMAGVTSASGVYSATTGTGIQFFANPNTTSDLPSTISPSSPVTVQVADDKKKVVIAATCTGLTLNSGGVSMQSNTSPLTDTLTGCTVPSADSGDTYTTKDQIGAPGATLESPAALAQTGEGSTNQDKLYKNNEDLTLLRVAYTSDGINFSSAGLDNNGIISGQSNGASSYTDINNPSSTTDPASGLNAYATPGTTDATEMRWVGSAGSIITNPNGTYGLFLSGAWSADGDSDAFNQIFYSSSSDGEHWTEPVSVVSTDYTFSASVAQDQALAGGHDAPLGISAYYSGRAYGPSVIQNPDGSLTMVFAGYRSPKPIISAGTVMGTNSGAQWTVGATDPALYRNILTVTLSSSSSPTVGTQTAASASPANAVVGQTVTLSATVTVPPPGTGTPTGSVDFTDGGGPLCSGVLSDTSPDTASCSTTYSSDIDDTVDATYSGDNNYASSSGTTTVDVTTLSTTPTADSTPAGTAYSGQLSTTGADGTVTYSQSTGSPDVTVSSSGAITAPDTLPVGNYTAMGGTIDSVGDTGTWTFTLTVNSTTLSTTPTVDSTTTVTPYSGQLSTTGGNGTVTYSQSTGTPELTVSSSGAISSTSPLAAGPYAASGTDTDALGDTGTWSFTLNVNSTTLDSTPTDDSTTAGTAYSGQLSTTGGAGATTYAQSSGTPELTVNSSGAISAPATLSVGNYKAEGTSSDAYGDSGQWSFTLTVNSTTLSTTPTVDSTTTVTPYSGQLSTTGGNGTVTYTQSTGSPELTVTSSGVISSTSPLAAGPYMASGTDTDALGDTGTWTFTLNVTATTLNSTPTGDSTPAGTAYTGQLSSSGGAGSIAYTESTGSPQLTVSSSGAISAPATLSVGQYTAQGTSADDYGDAGQWSFTLSVTSTLLSTTPTAASTLANVPYSGQLSTSGGTGTVTYSQSTGGPDVAVSSSGAISAPGTLANGPHTASGTETDALGDSGTWSFTLTVKPDPLPKVTRVSPSGGPVTGGTNITITGTGFVPGATVQVSQAHGSSAIAASNVTVVSSTRVTATTGGGAQAGLWNLTVTTAGGTSMQHAADDFTYFVPVPTVTGVSPASGPIGGGTPITITGTGFIAGASVDILQGGGSRTPIAATGVTVVSPTEITATTGGGARAGTWNLEVTTSGGTSKKHAADHFTYD